MTKFHAKPERVAAAFAQEANSFDAVVVIGRYRNGRLYMASSEATPDALKLVDRLPGELERLASIT